LRFCARSSFQKIKSGRLPIAGRTRLPILLNESLENRRTSVRRKRFVGDETIAGPAANMPSPDRSNFSDPAKTPFKYSIYGSVMSKPVFRPRILVLTHIWWYRRFDWCRFLPRREASPGTAKPSVPPLSSHGRTVRQKDRSTSLRPRGGRSAPGPLDAPARFARCRGVRQPPSRNPRIR